MRKFLNLLFTLIFFGQSTGLAALTNSDQQALPFQNLINNGGFENTKAGWTASANTFSIDLSNFYVGKASGLMSMSAQTGTLTNTVTPTVQTVGTNMEASCSVKTTQSTIQVCAMANGVELSCGSVPSTGNWSNVPINFVGPTNGQSVGVRVKATGSTTGTVNVDDCYVGKARNVGSVSQAVLMGSVVITGCSGSWNTTSGTFADYGVQTSCSYATSNQALAPATMIPGIRFASLPAGDYLISYEGTIGQTTATNGTYFRFSDGTNASREKSTVQGNANQYASGINHSISYSTAQTNVTLRVQGITSGSAAEVYGTTTNVGVIKVFYFPPTAQQAVSVNAAPSFTSPVAYTPVFTGFGTVSNVNIRSWRDASNLVIQGTFTVGTTTAVTASMTLGYNGVSGNVTSDSSLAASTPLTLVGMAVSNTTVSNNIRQFPVLGTASQTTVNFSYSQDSGTQNSLAAQLGSTFQSNQTLSLNLSIPIAGWAAPSAPVPILVGSVSSNSAGAERVERATIDLSSGSSCVISSQSGSWLTSCTRTATGKATLVYTGFTATPSCTVIGQSGAGASTFSYIETSSVTPSSTTMAIQQLNMSGGAGVDKLVQIICMGPR